MTSLKTTGIRQITSDLWETTADAPFPGLTTHAYLWRRPGRGNVLFYSVASDRDLDDIDRLGGVAHQYLSHRDEAGPMLSVLHARFGAVLHAPAAEAAAIARHRRPDVLLDEGGLDRNGVEIVPTPGHSPGSTCFAVNGAAGRYVFVGDTLFRTAEGAWAAGYLPGVSDVAALAASLDVLGDIEPDVVVSSAFAGESGAHHVDAAAWRAVLAEARGSLPASIR